MNPSRVIVVASLPRAGSSLVMQMLHAAGIRCGGGWPDFEPEEMNRPSADYIASMRGGAVKLLDPHRVYLPSGFGYDIIRLQRSKRQQARSSVKFLRSVGVPVKPMEMSDWTRMEQSLCHDSERARIILQQHHDARELSIRFEDLIGKPDATSATLAAFLELPDPRVMRQCIRSRKATCLPRMLELELLAESES